MEILVGHVASLKTSEPENLPEIQKTALPRKDRRRNKADRRKSVREGVFVCLSMKYDRRVRRTDRRVNSP